MDAMPDADRVIGERQGELERGLGRKAAGLWSSGRDEVMQQWFHETLNA